MSDQRGTIASVTQTVLTSLPAQFLALVLMNTAFLGALIWFLNNVDDRRLKAETAATEARERVLAPILATCMNTIPLDALRHMQQPAKP